MNEALIRNWNAVVGPDDLVFHLGDFAFKLCDEAERIRGIFHRLNGRKRLVLGNHDLRKDGSIHPTIADLPWDAPPAQIVETTDEGHRVVLCHYALRMWKPKRVFTTSRSNPVDTTNVGAGRLWDRGPD